MIATIVFAGCKSTPKEKISPTEREVDTKTCCENKPAKFASKEKCRCRDSYCSLCHTSAKMKSSLDTGIEHTDERQIKKKTVKFTKSYLRGGVSHFDI